MLAATINSVLPLVHTSRSVVIGLGDFGLQAISLLLPRLEVYYRFVATEAQPPIITRLGLVRYENGLNAYYTIDRSADAFVNVLHIQERILRLSMSAEQRWRDLLQLIGLQRADQPTSLRAWLDNLVQPVISDSLNYSESISHLHLYLIISACETDIKALSALIDELALIRRPPMTVNVVGYLDAPLFDQDPSEAKIVDFLNQLVRLACGGTKIHQIYLLDRSKQNLANVDSIGEAAFGVCNFLEQMVLSRLGDEVAERSLPDNAILAKYAPFCSFGAAKLYVPIAEITGELIEQIVTERLQKEVQRQLRDNIQDDIQYIAEQFEQNLNLGRLCSIILRDTPFELVPPPPSWYITLQELYWRFRGEAETPDIVRERLMRQVPRLRVSRRQWRKRLAMYGKRPSPEIWWRALYMFAFYLMGQISPLVIRRGAQRLGIRIADETLVYRLRTADERGDPIVNVLLDNNHSQRAEQLKNWITQQQLKVQPPIEHVLSGVAEQIFANKTISSSHLLSTLGIWFGHRLWVTQPQTGRLGAFNQEIRRYVASMLAHNLAWVKPLAQILQKQQRTITRVESYLKAWQETDAMHSLQHTPEVIKLRFRKARERLIRAMRARPYPAALITRLAVLWVLPILLAIIAAQSGIMLPSPWGEQLVTLIVSYTAGIVMIYVLVMGLALLRQQAAQRDLENLFFDYIARQVERAIYGVDYGSPSFQEAALSVGVIPAYLQAVKRLLVAEPLPDPKLPNSLYAVLATTHDQLSFALKPIETARFESILYQSIGDNVTRELLKDSFYRYIEQHNIELQTDVEELIQHLDSSDLLSFYLRKKLKIRITNEFSSAVRSTQSLLLHHILLLPEHQQIGFNNLINDMRLRSKPMLSLAQGFAQQALSREIFQYFGLTPQMIASNIQHQIDCHAQCYTYMTCDPYGLSCITFVQGLPIETLPLNITARGSR